MNWKSLDIAKLPERRSFGGTKLFTDAELAAAAKVLAKPDALSDGVDYATKEKARNRAGLVRAYLKKTHPDLKHGSLIVNDGTDDAPKFHWWIVPKKD